MKYWLAIMLLTQLFSAAALAQQHKVVEVKVQVQLNDHIRRYAYTPKLSEVLAPIALQRDWYWPASALYKMPDEAAELERNRVLAQLNTLQADADANLAQAINRVSYFISSWPLASRVQVLLDYDAVRIKPELNLGFDDGSYLLKLSTRPQTVEFWGAVKQVLSMPHSAVKTVTDYLPALNLSAEADTSYVLIIQPDGAVNRVGVANWNERHAELMPGSSVFIPFASALFQDLTPLNEDIARLARHRVK